MRMRNKPWAAPELNACPFFVRGPERLAGTWQGWFPRRQPIHLELGCGKGWYIAGLAPRNPDVNYLGVDLKDVVLAPAKRVVEAAFAEAGRPVDNAGLTAYNVEQICNILRPEDNVTRICINFCNPWPRAKHNKRRLTHPRRLNDYKQFLRPGGELWFKTDDDGLFADTLTYLEESGFTLLRQTADLHSAPGFFAQDASTEHEKMFMEKGILIKALAARWAPKAES